MNRSFQIGLLCCVTVIAVAAFWAGYRRASIYESSVVKPVSTGDVGAVEADITHADPMIVGRWQNRHNPQWYKVYYDDFDEKEQMFWGKEWNEAEDVMEYDLNYHGNGWFRWNKEGNILREYATMDNRDVPIHRAYKILLSTSDSLVCADNDYKKIIFRFSRIH